MGSDDGEKVQLYVYDLSNGLARQLSPMLLNKQVFAASVLTLIDPAAGHGQLKAVLGVCRSTASGTQLLLWEAWSTTMAVG